MKTGLITLLPKPKKDLMKLDNWRPITLLCNNYNKLALVYANRLEYVLAQLVGEFQSTFIKVRYIHNNVRLIFDMMDYQCHTDLESFILFIYSFKAYAFLIRTLKIGFGEKFCRVSSMFYNDICSYICLNPGITPRLKVSMESDKVDPYHQKLSILCTQLLAHLIVNHSQLKGINIFGCEFYISLLMI